MKQDLAKKRLTIYATEDQYCISSLKLTNTDTDMIWKTFITLLIWEKKDNIIQKARK